MEIFMRLLTGLLCSLCCLAQQAVQAQDDMPDYRSKRENFSKILEKDIRNDLATFTMAGIDESMGKPPLRSIRANAYGANYISFADSTGDIQVTISTEPFDPLKHKIGKYEEYIVKIDNKGYVGNYGKMPHTTIKAVTVVVKGDTLAVPPAAFQDVHDPVFTYTEGGVVKSYNTIYFSGDGHRMYVYLLKRKDNDRYEVTWVFRDKQYVRRVVDYAF
jgi:hypothetical protein